jgi:hypothetical protein
MTTEHDEPFGSDPISDFNSGVTRETSAGPVEPGVDPFVSADEPPRNSPHVRAPVTGDPDIDSTLAEVATAQGENLASRIEAGEEAQRVLQARLRDLGSP